MKRFVKEYARDIINREHQRTWKTFDEIDKNVERVRKLCGACERGYISETETMFQLATIDKEILL